MNNKFSDLSNYILHDYTRCSFDSPVRENLINFLKDNPDFESRQSLAIEIITEIMKPHGKDALCGNITELARIEYGIRELDPKHRDHVVHAVLTYLLGIYINENFFISNQFREIDPFQWKITGLFHDIGYPLQIANRLIQPYLKQINYLKRQIDPDSDQIAASISIIGLEKLTNEQNGLDLIQNQLDKWNLEINAKNEYDNMIESGIICHGIISSLTLLNYIDLFYQECNPERVRRFTPDPKSGADCNQEYFEKDIVAACSAIFLHNLPKDSFSETKICLSAPLPFLLKLSDILQEWERPSLENERGYPSEDFDIAIEGKKLIVTANIPEDRKQKMKEEIDSSLDCSEIEIEII